MSIVVFRNYNLQEIKSLMEEIGKERMKCALKDAGMERPLSMEGFYLEYEVKSQNINLYFRYPSNTSFFLLPILGFWRIPKNGWVMERKN
ncbi:hypothetical protein [uncultured Croceitalea sp.]|uniref:hypothetical protein n=1 Tax=uncultured Croceitalea sp. TaxID=1798908 RepID=UPI003305DE3C